MAHEPHPAVVAQDRLVQAQEFGHVGGGGGGGPATGFATSAGSARSGRRHPGSGNARSASPGHDRERWSSLAWHWQQPDASPAGRLAGWPSERVAGKRHELCGGGARSRGHPSHRPPYHRGRRLLYGPVRDSPLPQGKSSQPSLFRFQSGPAMPGLPIQPPVTRWSVYSSPSPRGNCASP